MKQVSAKNESSQNLVTDFQEHNVDKHIIALDSLSKLTRQFADNPDFNELLEIILYTFSGQFAVGSCFITIRDPQSRIRRSIYKGMGKYKERKSFELLGSPEIDSGFILKNTKTYRVEDLVNRINDEVTKRILSEGNLKVLVPLMHGNSLLGLIGFGDKLRNSEFEDSELELMTSISHAITPLLVNSFLFKEISDLSNWYHEIINNVKLGVFVFDENRRLAGVNEAGCNFMKNICGSEYSEKTISNKKIEEVFVDQYFHSWISRITDSLRGVGGDLVENAIAGSGESKKVFNVRITSIGRVGHEKGDLVITLDDMTQQKQNEQKMFDLERLADKGLMAASISHELNNFLGLILAGVELTQASLERSRSDDANTSLEKVKGNISKMIRYTAGLMDYTRLETNKQKANLNEIITDVLSFLAVQRRFSRHSIKTELESALPTLGLDADQIAQLLLNILNNASDAISEAKQNCGVIKIKTVLSGDSVVLKISDNGAGMSNEVKEMLFNKQLTTKPGGHGYGLVTCGKIVKNHGGRIEIVSQPGAGTTFEIHLPLK